MNPLDLAVIGILALSAIFAFARGFVREALSIIAWGGAAAITLYGFNWVYARVDPMVHNALLSQLIAGFGLFVISLVVLTILTGIVARMVHATGLSPIDRTLGFIFGLARGAFQKPAAKNTEADSRAECTHTENDANGEYGHGLDVCDVFHSTLLD